MGVAGERGLEEVVGSRWGYEKGLDLVICCNVTRLACAAGHDKVGLGGDGEGGRVRDCELEGGVRLA